MCLQLFARMCSRHRCFPHMSEMSAMYSAMVGSLISARRLSTLASFSTGNNYTLTFHVLDQ